VTGLLRPKRATLSSKWLVGLQTIQPTDLVVALQSFFGVLREMKTEVAMTSAHHLAVGRIAELLETVLSDGLEQAIARITPGRARLRGLAPGVACLSGPTALATPASFANWASAEQLRNPITDLGLTRTDEPDHPR